MSEPWTPGPWNISGLERDFSIWGVANGMEVGSREAICFDVQRIDDARLISLAPEMAELLAKCADEIEGLDFSEHNQMGVGPYEPSPTIGEIRALLARARGEA